MRMSRTVLFQILRSLVLPAALGVPALQLWAQAPLRFEVVSIHPHKPTGDDPSNRQMLPGGRFVATGTSVRTLLRVAFGIGDNRMQGTPGWIDEETFDIEGVTEGRAEVSTQEQFQLLMLSLLEDRFGLKFHLERKEAAVYWLEVDKPGRLGAGIKPHGSGGLPNMSVNLNGVTKTMRAVRIPMAEVAATLARQAGRPVEDHTGLEGTYDFQIAWSPEDTPNSTEPSLFTVLKEQLGLKLRAAKGMAEELVVDEVTQPSPN